MLRDIPPGTHCFVDANIFYYHLVETPPLSEECSNFFERVERGDVTASTSSVAVAEAIHKVMLADAVAQHNLDRAGLAHRLQRHRQQIATLTEHTKVTALVHALSIHVEPVTLSTLERAALISIKFQLLTNDALTLAVMDHLALKVLVTNDENFDTAEITVWKPR
ncbi:MAG: type II toxin-antitoxin system VapC family toxin [Pyrinomonadaceae bacterium]